MKTISLVFVLVSTILSASGQSFVNLGFESANVVPFTSYFPPWVQFSNAFPGWAGSLGGASTTAAISNDLLYSQAPGFAILDTNYSTTTLYGAQVGLIAGNYTAVLRSGYETSVAPVDASLSQVGLVPDNAQSLQFKANLVSPDGHGAFSVTLGGQPLTLQVLGSGPDYTLYGADVSSFAGQVEQLAFDVAPGPSLNSSDGNEYLFLDAIDFSSSAIPEPTFLELVGVAISFVVLGRKIARKRQRWSSF